MSISKKDFTSALVKKNRFIEMVTDIRQRGESLYIWGDGLGGRQVAFVLDSHDISYDGFAVNKSFYRQKTKTVCLEELCEHSKEHSLNLVVAFRGFTPDIINKSQHKINLYEEKFS